MIGKGRARLGDEASYVLHMHKNMTPSMTKATQKGNQHKGFDHARVHRLCLCCRINVGALIVYHMTLSDDLDDLYLAELEDDVARTTRKASLPETKPQTQSKDPLL